MSYGNPNLLAFQVQGGPGTQENLALALELLAHMTRLDLWNGDPNSPAHPDEEVCYTVRIYNTETALEAQKDYELPVPPVCYVQDDTSFPLGEHYWFQVATGGAHPVRHWTSSEYPDEVMFTQAVAP